MLILTLACLDLLEAADTRSVHTQRSQFSPNSTNHFIMILTCMNVCIVLILVIITWLCVAVYRLCVWGVLSLRAQTAAECSHTVWINGFKAAVQNRPMSSRAHELKMFSKPPIRERVVVTWVGRTWTRRRRVYGKLVPSFVSQAGRTGSPSSPLYCSRVIYHSNIAE